MPHTEMLNRRTGWPRLASSAGRLLGAAVKSIASLASNTRSCSGFCQRRNSTRSACSASAPLSSMCSKGKLTTAAGPARRTTSSRGGAALPCRLRDRSISPVALRLRRRMQLILMRTRLIFIRKYSQPSRDSHMTNIKSPANRLDAVQLLRADVLFADLPESLFAPLLSPRGRQEAAAGELLFREGDRAGHFLLVQQGCIEMFRFTADGEERVNL